MTTKTPTKLKCTARSVFFFNLFSRFCSRCGGAELASSFKPGFHQCISISISITTYARAKWHISPQPDNKQDSGRSFRHIALVNTHLHTPK